MTELSPEARELVEQLTAVPFEWWAGALVVAIVGGIAAAIVKAPLEDGDLSRLDLMDRGHCGATRGSLVCGRHAGHEGAHVDPFHGTQYGPSRWTDGRAA